MALARTGYQNKPPPLACGCRPAPGRVIVTGDSRARITTNPNKTLRHHLRRRPGPLRRKAPLGARWLPWACLLPRPRGESVPQEGEHAVQEVLTRARVEVELVLVAKRGLVTMSPEDRLDLCS